MVGAHTCIRVIKQTRALKKKGYKVDVATNKLSYGTDEFERIYFWYNNNQLRSIYTCKEIMSQYDLVHVHNEPDFMAVVASNCNISPLVLDVHDLDSVRFKHDNMTNIDEVRAFNAVDGAIFVSKPIEAYAKELHKFDKPTTVFAHYCNDDFLSLYEPGKDLNRTGIVYEGGANPPVPDGHTPFKYRSLYHLMKQIVDMGNELHMYIGNMDGFEAYQDIGAFVYPPTHYDEMMKGMATRKWGALVFNNEDLTEEQTNLTTMNKAYEYIMAGCPLIIMGAPHQAEVLRKYGVAIELEKLSDLGNVEQKWGHMYPQLKENVDKARKLLTTERYIHIIEKLYKAVLDNTKHK
jgi:hypothetical protein